MRRFITVGLLILTTCFLAAYTWFYSLKPEMEGNTNFLTSGAGTTRTITVPLGGTEYIDIVIDGVNTELMEGNNLTTWRFNDITVIRTREHLDGKPYSGNCWYMSNREVYGQYGDYYVSAVSDNRLVGVTAECLVGAQPYTASHTPLTEDNMISELPQVDSNLEYDIEGEWKLPKDVTELVMSSSSDDKSYYKNGWYFNYNFRYQKRTDAIEDAATRVCAISKQDIDWWYDDGEVFIAKAGNEYACVRQNTYTSCDYISSNDLSYILLNLSR